MPYAPPSVALVVCWHLGFSQALRALFWFVACGHVSGVCPRPPLSLACFAASAARPARPPPEGAPSEPRWGHAAFGGEEHRLLQLLALIPVPLAV